MGSCTPSPPTRRASVGRSWASGCAAERAAAMPWPTAAEEIWRYSRIGDLDLERFGAGQVDTRVEAGDAAAYVTTDETPWDSLKRGASTLRRVRRAEQGVPPIRSRVDPAGQVVAQPIVLDHHIGSGATFPRLVIDAGEDSEVTVADRFGSVDDELLAVPVVHVRAGPAAGVGTWPSTTCPTGPGRSAISRRAVTLTRRSPWAPWPWRYYAAGCARKHGSSGRGGTTKQLALYFADGEQMHDFRRSRTTPPRTGRATSCSRAR